MEETNTKDLQSASVSPMKPIRCIVKLGGAAITCKNELETINEANLKTVSSQLRQSMTTGSPSGEVLGMDWSKQPGESEISSAVLDFEHRPVADPSPFIVVHGAGSFGHFQASKSGVHKGGLYQPLVKAGFVATRISVTKLNLEIVRALAREGIPSIGMSPFSCGWSTRERNIASADLSAVAKAIESGLVPVLHGDAVLDELLDCTILSGDVIISHLAAHLKPDFVVFLTNAKPVALANFTGKGELEVICPLSQTQYLHLESKNASSFHKASEIRHLEEKQSPTSWGQIVLLREIAVAKDGSWSIVSPTLENMNKQVETKVAAHDTTGGMMTKISEAAVIAKLGIDVYIVKAATTHALRALSGELKGSIPDDWLGTAIRFSNE